jgi:hypothetical protein
MAGLLALAGREIPGHELAEYQQDFLTPEHRLRARGGTEERCWLDMMALLAMGCDVPGTIVPAAKAQLH